PWRKIGASVSAAAVDAVTSLFCFSLLNIQASPPDVKAAKSTADCITVDAPINLIYAETSNDGNC
uniref:Uncharacterized protein n=1 Tax=Oryza brachyantha TaxID=4533 RepID=J3N7I5_ORYBR